MKRILVGMLIVVLSLSMVLVLHDQQEMRDRLSYTDSYCQTISDVLSRNALASVMDSCVIVCIGELGHGSGVVLENGVVVTAQHCANTDLAMTVIQNGVVFEVAEIVLSECWDTAILIVPGITGGVELADEDTLSLMDTVYVIGTPWSREFDHNATVGLFCDFDVDWEDWVDTFRISADAAPGNSGGGVFDIFGRLVGIVVAGPDPGSGVTIIEPAKHFEELLNGRPR